MADILHTCDQGVPKNMCYSCLLESQEEYERNKQRKEDQTLLFAAPELEAELKEEIMKERARRAADKDSPSHKMFLALKRSEEKEMLANLERQKEAEAKGEMLKQHTWKELDEMRKKYPKSTDEHCAATADHQHAYGLMRVAGQSWHGPVLSKDCCQCGYSWSNH